MWLEHMSGSVWILEGLSLIRALGSMPSKLGRHWGFGAEEYREPFQKDPSSCCLKKKLQGSKSGSREICEQALLVTQRTGKVSTWCRWQQWEWEEVVACDEFRR